ncbi:hypothetical protein [Burkholderia sp. L27(2015)]|uniref:hypothetical protein n=1 Tax=Burkholderia sp. L27(2015) TaxID=1641858 RepID=UPI00131C7AC6|nr:hypothetical protein [Burkholderia sp. L27(2015)]
MNQRQMGKVAVVAMVLSLISGCAVADDAYFVDRHPNIAAADFNAEQAIERMRAAQRANNYDMGGHAGRAIGLLEQARYEMAAAAQDATR